MLRRFGYVWTGILAASLVASSCGTVSKVTTARAVSNSFTDVGKQSGATITLSLGVSASQFQQMDKTASPTAAQAISSGAIVIQVQSGHGEAINSKQFAKDSSNSIGFGVKIGSSTPIEIRYVGQNLYVHADIAGLLSSVGASSSSGSQFQSGLQQLDQYVPGLGALGQGKWVEISHSSLQQLGALAKQASGAFGGSTPSSTPPNQSQILAGVGKIRNDVIAALKNNTTYKNAGTSNGRTHYQLIIAVRPFVQQAGAALSNDLGSLPGGSLFAGRVSGGLGKVVSQIPATQTAVIDEFVQDNKAQEVDVDLNQFDHKQSFPVPLKIVVGSSPSIGAPSGATPLDLSKLPQLLSGMLGKVGAGSG